MAKKDKNWEQHTDEERITIFKLKGKEEMDEMKEIFRDVYCPAKYGTREPLKEDETQQLVCVCSQIGAGKSYTIGELRKNLEQQFGEPFVEIDTDSCKPFTPKYKEGRKADMACRERGEVYTGENYTRTSAPQSDYLKQLALDDQGKEKTHHVLYEFAVRNSSKEKIFESLRSFADNDKGHTDKRAIVLAVPYVVSATSIFGRAEKDYYDKNKVYIPAEINVHDESYAQMPAAINEAYHRNYFDDIVITDREGRVLYDSPDHMTEEQRQKVDIEKEIQQARETYFEAHPNWKEEINKNWEEIFASMDKRKAPKEQRETAEKVHALVVKEMAEIERKLKVRKAVTQLDKKPKLGSYVSDVHDAAMRARKPGGRD